MLNWCTHDTLHHVLHVRSNMLISKFGSNRARTPILSLLLHTQNSPIPITLTPSLPNSLPCLEPTFSRRTSGHCVGTCRATKCPVNFPATLQLSNTNICVQTGQFSDHMTVHRDNSLWIKPTDAPNSNFIGITTLHVLGSLSAHHQFLAVHRHWYILCRFNDRLLPGAGCNWM